MDRQRLEYFIYSAGSRAAFEKAVTSVATTSGDTPDFSLNADEEYDCETTWAAYLGWCMHAAGEGWDG